MADEVFQRGAESAGITVELVGGKLQHLRQLSCVGSVQGHSGHEIAAFSVSGVVAAARAGMAAFFP
jgi:hypothetical protein